MLLTDIAIFASIWLFAQFAFHGFEAHVPLVKRILKFVVLAGLLFTVYRALGRSAYYMLLGALTLGIATLHGYWFHYKHGIHWRKAEPREKYLALIGKPQQKESK